MSRLTVVRGDRSFSFSFPVGRDLLEVLRRAGVSVPSPCGGKGICGKCLVEVTWPDGRKETVRACSTTPADGMTVTVKEEDIAAEGVTERSVFMTDGEEGLGLAFDVGTTTLAAALADLSDGRVLSRAARPSRQLAFGADVVTRMRYALESEEKARELTRMLRGQLEDMAGEMLAEAGRDKKEIKRAVFSGNTVMEHFLAGEDTSPMAGAPYVPNTLFGDMEGGWSLRGSESFFMPCVSGFVGGDITAGLSTLPKETFEGRALYLDVGTNGEMVLIDNGEMISCSAATGPALEGWAMDCGMTASEGAVESVSFDGEELKLSVIGDIKPKGICGSGILDAAAVMINAGIVDETGRMPDEGEYDGPLADRLGWDDDGRPVFFLDSGRGIYVSQKDMRQIQLAKRALAAGIDILLGERGLTADGLDRIYVAGGFGRHLDARSCFTTGLLPRVNAKKVLYLGNTSLAGALGALCSKEKREGLPRLRKSIRYLELSGLKDFNDRFVGHMAFDGI